jgi:kinase-associated protein B
MRIVKAQYKTGAYIGEEEEEKNGQVLIKILAVVKHPLQGDLHNPKRADVPFFQERRALSYGERTWVPVHTVKPFDEAVPDYKNSLKQSLQEHIAQLEAEDSEYGRKSILCLMQLQKDYRLS